MVEMIVQGSLPLEQTLEFLQVHHPYSSCVSQHLLAFSSSSFFDIELLSFPLLLTRKKNWHLCCYFEMMMLVEMIVQVPLPLEQTLEFLQIHHPYSSCVSQHL